MRFVIFATRCTCCAIVWRVLACPMTTFAPRRLWSPLENATWLSPDPTADPFSKGRTANWNPLHPPALSPLIKRLTKDLLPKSAFQVVFLFLFFCNFSFSAQWSHRFYSNFTGSGYVDSCELVIDIVIILINLDTFSSLVSVGDSYSKLPGISPSGSTPTKLTSTVSRRNLADVEVNTSFVFPTPPHGNQAPQPNYTVDNEEIEKLKGEMKVKYVESRTYTNANTPNIFSRTRTQMYERAQTPSFFFWLRIKTISSMTFDPRWLPWARSSRWRKRLKISIEDSFCLPRKRQKKRNLPLERNSCWLKPSLRKRYSLGGRVDLQQNVVTG